VARLNRATGELVSRGVVLVDTGGPTYVFTGLNAIKPEMLAQASANARTAAQQFAADVDSTLGGIRRASQGIFEILPRDAAPGISEASQIDKQVRVVSTIEYLLEPYRAKPGCREIFPRATLYVPRRRITFMCSIDGRMTWPSRRRMRALLMMF
jgi:hypothetical protein